MLKIKNIKYKEIFLELLLFLCYYLKSYLKDHPTNERGIRVFHLWILRLQIESFRKNELRERRRSFFLQY